jgi:hypothetical protein
MDEATRRLSGEYVDSKQKERDKGQEMMRYLPLFRRDQEGKFTFLGSIAIKPSEYDVASKFLWAVFTDDSGKESIDSFPFEEMEDEDDIPIYPFDNSLVH